MMNLRSVGGLLAISTVLSCATAINDGTVPGPQTLTAGSDSGGGAGLDEEGGAPAGGAPQAGAPNNSAGKSGSGKGGSGSAGTGGSGSAGKGGSGSAGSGSAGKGGSGSGGTVGASGSSTGGKAGTSSSGAAGSSAGADGTAGAPSTGPCASPVDLPTAATGNSGNFNTLGAVCFRTKSTFNSLGCSNFAGRTIKVNDVLDTCDGKKKTFAAAIDGWNYFDVSAGTLSYASFGWYTS